MATSGRRLHRIRTEEKLYLYPLGDLFPKVEEGRLNPDVPSELGLGSEDRRGEHVPPPAAQIDTLTEQEHHWLNSPVGFSKCVLWNKLLAASCSSRQRLASEEVWGCFCWRFSLKHPSLLLVSAYSSFLLSSSSSALCLCHAVPCWNVYRLGKAVVFHCAASSKKANITTSLSKWALCAYAQVHVWIHTFMSAQILEKGFLFCWV